MSYAHRVKPGEKVKLKHFDPNEDAGLSKEDAKTAFTELNAQLDVMQEEAYAADQHAILVLFQGMDTAGKDGAIRRVFEHMNPQGVHVASFKVPSEEELAHDYLWRIHQQTPKRGQVTIFNRSHYEDVLVVRVHNLVSKKVWKARYEQINNFERHLAENNTLIFKFFLHISKEEQEQRLLEREQEIEKAWKLSAGDWKERTHWEDYQAAYEDALSKCSTAEAPWHIIPANRKWFRDLAVAQVLVDGLSDKRKKWKATLKEMSAARMAELAAYRASLHPSPPGG